MIQDIRHNKDRLYLFIIGALLFNLFNVEFTFSKEKPFLAEKCYIDNDYVLLYKILNWWNDCQPGEDGIVCGKSLRCESTGISQIQYNGDKNLLTINSDSDLEELIAVFKNCKGCMGPSYLECTYLNNKYFKTQSLEDVSKINGTINIITIQNVTFEDATRIIKNEKNITIILEGTVGGLLEYNSKIALHRAGSFLKKCPITSKSSAIMQEIKVTVKNSLTEEVLVKYSAIFNEK